jgi:hypothetical protein
LGIVVQEKMKTITIIALFCSFAGFAIANELSVTTNITTNVTANIVRQIKLHKESDQRILEIEKITAIRGDSWVITQKLFWHDEPVVEVSTTSFSKDVNIRFYALPGVDAITTSDDKGQIKQISLVSSNLQILVACELKNGQLIPLSKETIVKSNAIMNNISDTFGRFIKKESSRDQFMSEIKEIEKKAINMRKHNQ